MLEGCEGFLRYKTEKVPLYSVPEEESAESRRGPDLG